MTYYEKRLALVKKMDKVIRNLNDEDFLDSWLMCGVPDEATDEDYEWFAENADEFLDLVSLYIKITKKAMAESGAI